MPSRTITANGKTWLVFPSGRVTQYDRDEFGLIFTGTPNTAGSTVVKQFGDGSQVTYTYNATLGLYTAPLGNGPTDTVSYNASTGNFTWTDGTTRATQTYDSSTGLMASSADSSGNVTTYTYTGILLTQITDPSGQTTTFDYDADGGLTAISAVYCQFCGKSLPNPARICAPAAS